MKECVDALVAYFNEELPKLEHNYQWKIPNIDGFADSGEKGYAPNVKLKKHFQRRWQDAAQDKEEQFRKEGIDFSTEIVHGDLEDFVES